MPKIQPIIIKENMIVAQNDSGVDKKSQIVRLVIVYCVFSFVCLFIYCLPSWRRKLSKFPKISELVLINIVH